VTASASNKAAANEPPTPSPHPVHTRLAGGEGLFRYAPEPFAPASPQCFSDTKWLPFAPPHWSTFTPPLTQVLRMCQSNPRTLGRKSSADKANPRRQQEIYSHLRFGLMNWAGKPVNVFPWGSALAYVGLAEAAVLLQLPQKLPQSPKTQEANRFRSASKSFIMRLVRRRGLEPLCLAALAPQASASANFATSACRPQAHFERFLALYATGYSLKESPGMAST
jgi:hypothetical protein